MCLLVSLGRQSTISQYIAVYLSQHNSLDSIVQLHELHIAWCPCAVPHNQLALYTLVVESICYLPAAAMQGACGCDVSLICTYIIALLPYQLTHTNSSWYMCRLRKVVEGRRGFAKLHTWEHLVLGGVSGACAATATMPLDLAKTTIQCGSSQPVRQVLQTAVQEHGPAGLFRGMVSFNCTRPVSTDLQCCAWQSGKCAWQSRKVNSCSFWIY